MFLWSPLILAAALVASSAFAAPSPRGANFQPPTQETSCYVSASVLQNILPADQTTIVAPSSPPNFVALGVGVQNYTCSSTGTFTVQAQSASDVTSVTSVGSTGSGKIGKTARSNVCVNSKINAHCEWIASNWGGGVANINIGAYAELFDISCIAAAPVQTAAFKVWSASSQTTQELVDTFGDQPYILGQHYFIANPTPGGANVPKFDFTSDRFKGDPTKFVVAARVGDLPAPTGSGDIDWLALNRTSGELANQVFRVSTVAGTDSAACSAGETASVKYVAKYFFY